MNKYQKELLKEHKEIVESCFTQVMESLRELEYDLKISKRDSKVRINKLSNHHILYNITTEDKSYILVPTLAEVSNAIKMCEENEWSIVNWDDVLDWVSE